MLMTAYLGWHRTAEVVVDVEILECGAGRCDCFECGGTGNWGPFFPEPLDWSDCVDCKGTGKILISV